MTPLARELAAISAREMVAALGVRNVPQLLERSLALPFFAASCRLGETLATFAADVSQLGLPEAAGRALSRFGVGLSVSGLHIPEGPCLVLANHPGAYDALALMRAIDRRDLLVLAADRRFLRALPGLSEHLVFVPEDAAKRAGALKRSLRWLRRGGALLHFPAGRIEADADFAAESQRLLEPWQPGVSSLVAACERACGQLVVAGVRGVHSVRAKRLRLNRWAERRGVTTLSPLLQLVGRLRDVHARVHLAGATDRNESVLRHALLNAIAAA